MKIGFIDYYLDEWHANNYPSLIRALSGGAMDIACAYGKIDSPLPGGRTSAQWSGNMGIPLCDTIEEVITKSDALIVLAPDNSEMHEELCQLPLRSGKPTYVDKTFAPDGQTARRLATLAEKSGTPCFSTSALRFAEEYRTIGRGGITAISSWGPGDFETYAIHQIEPVVMLISSAPRRVLYTAVERWYALVLEFEDNRYATVSGFMDGSPFMMNLCDKSETRIVTITSDFFTPFIKELIDFFATGKAPLDVKATLMIMDILEAGKKAQKKPGVWIPIYLCQ